MKSKLLLGVDIGTTGAKAIAFDLSGAIVTMAYREYGCSYPRQGWAEQNADELVSTAFSLVKEVTGKLGERSKDICSLGISTQRNASIFLDKDGKAMSMLTWQDSRSYEEVNMMRKKVGDNAHYRVTGLPISENWYLPKILWAEKNAPELWDKTERVVQLMEYIGKAFGAQDYYLPENDANFTSCWDVAALKWNEDFICTFGMKEKARPKLAKTNEATGTISDKIAEELGLPKGLKLPVALGDTACASYGAGINSPGDVSVSMGTGGVTIAALDKPVFHENAAFMLTHHIIRNRWQWEGLQMASAGVFRWLKNLMYSSGVSYDDINSAIASVPAGSQGVIVLPYFAGSGTPYWNNEDRGTVLGLSLSHGREHLMRACMEGITLEQKMMVRELKSTGISIDSIRIMGGPTRSKVWNQIQADMYGVPVSLPTVTEAAALGAAMVGGVVNGVFTTFGEAAEAMVRTSMSYEPNMHNAEVYEELFILYKTAYEGLSTSGFTKQLNSFNKRRNEQ